MEITLTDYQVYFDDITDNDVFMRLLAQAESLVSSQTARRSDEVTEPSDFRYIPLKMCLIFTVQYLKSSGVFENGGIKSVSNDGYSETYSTPTDKTDELKGLIINQLSGTGLTGCF